MKRNRLPVARWLRITGWVFAVYVTCVFASTLIFAPGGLRKYPVLIQWGGIVSLVLLSWMRKPKVFAAVGPQGLTICRYGGPIKTHPWGTVGPARYDVLRRAVIVSVAGKEKRLSLGRFFHGNAAEADRCVRGINDCALRRSSVFV